MPEQFTIAVDGATVQVESGMTVAVAVALRGASCRRSVQGENRGPLCGMGICMECRVEIDGIPHCLACRVLCRPGMEVRTGG
jgi:predicted molibdopterin-dependent oxidoreductase YjgC